VSHQGPARAVLDADIIYSRVLYELMGRTATRLRLLDLFWSDELLAEAKQSLIEKKQLTNDVAQRWVDYLRHSFPGGRISLDETTVAADLAGLTTDPADQHVCALALAAGADYLLTRDRGYLHEGLRRHGVEVIPPDKLLVATFGAHEQGLLDVLELQASSWAGGRPVDELIDAIGRAGAVAFAEMARHSLGLSS
jgi:predicted nucleic acid-binding protein